MPMTTRSAAVLVAAACLAAVPAAAHVVLATREAPAGSHYQAVFLVSHGCEGGAATVGLRVEIPAGIVTAKPMPKPGWTLEVAREALAEPVTVEGHVLTRRVKAVTWRGGRLPDDEFDAFTALVRLPPDRAGPLYFPTVQLCEGGAETAWTDPPPPGGTTRDVRHPPPAVVLTAPAGAR